MRLSDYAQIVHEANAKWWCDLSKPCDNCGAKGFLDCFTCPKCNGFGYAKLENRNIPEMLCLIHSEISEALEGYRKNLQDDKLPQYKMFDVEIVDTLIRLFDLAKGTGIDLDSVFEAKMKYNAIRKDHSIEERLKEGGKKI